MTYRTDDWRGLYKAQWGEEIVPDAFAHPAKYARGLIRYIYQHCLAEGWLKVGDAVCDPFGGVALGALDAMTCGLHYVGVELEPKFVALAQANIDRWHQRYAGKLAGAWGSAQIVQGDSRQFATQVRTARAAVSSPPYNPPFSQDHNGSRGGMRGTTPSEDGAFAKYGNTAGQLEGLAMTEDGLNAAIASPPWGDGIARDTLDKDARRAYAREHGISNAEHVSPIDMDSQRRQSYGDSVGNLGNLAATDDGLALAVSSPPYQSSYTNAGGDVDTSDEKRASIESKTGVKLGGGQLSHSKRYGASEGQLGAMPDGDLQAAISSPPYEGSRVANGEAQKGDIRAIPEHIDSYGAGSVRRTIKSRDDFWSAARTIVAQTYEVLCPDAHVIWVVKAFVRKKQIVDFPDQWRRLCESVGFVTLHEHRAWVVEENGDQLMIAPDFDTTARFLRLDGSVDHKNGAVLSEAENQDVERKSFFRRLAEKHGSPRVDFETVWCMVKPV